MPQCACIHRKPGLGVGESSCYKPEVQSLSNLSNKG